MKFTNPLTTLRSWLNENGGFIHPSISRSSNNGVFGIVATEPIKEDEVLVRVPSNLIIDYKKFNQYQSLKKFNCLDKIEQTIAILLEEKGKGEDSLYFPWLQFLPTLSEFKDFHPYFYSQKELEEIGHYCPRALETIVKFDKKVNSFKNKVNNHYPKSDIEWAFAVYFTRAFEGNGLVPVCDLFNHNSQKGRGLINDNTLQTKSNLNQGNEVYISYGENYDTLELWINFGFLDMRANHCIGCSNILNTNNQIVFDNDSFIDSSGPSPKLWENCILLGDFYTMSPEVVFAKIVSTLKSDFSINPNMKPFSKNKIFFDILEKRFELLENVSNQDIASKF